MKRINGTDVEVSQQDQQDINSISRLLQKKQELDQNLAKAKERVSQYKDSLQQMELNDDQDIVRYRFATSFFYLPTQKVKQIVEKEQHKAKIQQKQIMIQRQETNKKIGKLKAKLYGKFGNAINLDQ